MLYLQGKKEKFRARRQARKLAYGRLRLARFTRLKSLRRIRRGSKGHTPHVAARYRWAIMWSYRQACIQPQHRLDMSSSAALFVRRCLVTYKPPPMPPLLQKEDNDARWTQQKKHFGLQGMRKVRAFATFL